MPSFPPNLGNDLYRILPEVYRNRDEGDLEAFLGGCGGLLDLVYQTLVQKLADQFPDNPDGGLPGPDAGLPCQEWLLPYFADLLDVRLVSPLANGRRDEISNAIAWRQRKGTLAVIEQISERIGLRESVLQEGWKRVAMTPLVGKPLLPATAYGYAAEPPPSAASLAARHPDLPAVTVDFRCSSGAVETTRHNPGAQTATVAGVERLWRQASYHGAPCRPESYEDVSRRTVDFRRPDWRRGHYHPRRILLFSPPPAGFFAEGLKTVLWTDRATVGGPFQSLIEIDDSDPTATAYRNKSRGTDEYVPVRIQGVIALDDPTHTWRFEGLILDDAVTVASGRIQLVDCAMRNVNVLTVDDTSPVFEARDSLFGQVSAAGGLCRFEYCTVLEETLAALLQASDCIFVGSIRKQLVPLLPPDSGCIRYSRVSPQQVFAGISTHNVTSKTAFFFSAVFGERGAGVLHPETSEEIGMGAEDGGEMGAFHNRFYSRIRSAVAEKLADFVPIGIEAVLVPDSVLLDAPAAPPKS